jgi:hypothetical protein
MAHFMTHLQYAMDPIFGSNPIVAPVFMPACLEHLKQHLTLWYLMVVDGYASTALGRPFDIMKIGPVVREAQKLISVATQHVHEDGKQELTPVLQTIQSMLQTMQKMHASQDQEKLDPNVKAQVDALTQTSMAETQRKAQKDQMDAKLKAEDMQRIGDEKLKQLQVDVIKNTENNLTAERIKSAELTRDAAQLQHEQLQTVLDAQNQIQSNLGANPNV